MNVIRGFDFIVGVKKDLVLHDFSNDNSHLVVGFQVDQRTPAAVKSGHALLNQSGQFESSANFLNNRFFSKFVIHALNLLCYNMTNGVSRSGDDADARSAFPARR